jgi:hypothetical protein
MLVILLAALVHNKIPPKMKQGGKTKPVQRAKIEGSCDKSMSVKWYVLLFIEYTQYIICAD